MFAAIVMSKEEALALPLEKRPICFRINSKTYTAIWEAIGSASLCWDPKPTNEVFDTNQASKVATDLCFVIAEEMERREAELRNALGWILPMAKGYASEHAVGNNAGLCEHAQQVFISTEPCKPPTSS